MLRISVLGPPELSAGGADLGGQPRKTLGLLAYLAMHQGRVVSRETAADLLWGLSGPEQSRQSLRQALLVLRRALGPFAGSVVAGSGGLSIPSSAAEVDAIGFQSLAGAASLADLDRCAALYRGDFLAGFPDVSPQFEEWLAWERRRLADLAADALARLALLRMRASETEGAVAAARRVVALDPLREDSHRLLMEILTHAGRRAEALRHYDEFREMLQRELDVAPHPTTTALYRRIRDEARLAPRADDVAGDENTAPNGARERKTDGRTGEAPGMPPHQLAPASVC